MSLMSRSINDFSVMTSSIHSLAPAPPIEELTIPIVWPPADFAPRADASMIPP
jgi:hypothetical protein